MNWNDFASPKVVVKYANGPRANKILAWAKKNNAVVKLTRYASDAYEGHVVVHTNHMESKEQTDLRVTALKAIIKGNTKP